eukprot:3605437-Rhodomonas_salina.1
MRGGRCVVRKRPHAKEYYVPGNYITADGASERPLLEGRGVEGLRGVEGSRGQVVEGSRGRGVEALCPCAHFLFPVSPRSAS